MRLSRIGPCCGVLVACAIWLPSAAAAGPGGGGGDGPTPPPQTGPITVDYETDGGRSTTTTITSGSAFRNQGGGDRSPCTFNWLPDNDGDGIVDADAEYTAIDSDRWVFRETTSTYEGVTDGYGDDEWEALAGLGGTTLSETIATYGSVDTAFRRFDVFCNGTHGSGTSVNQSRGSVTVSINDAFWGYASRRDQLLTLLPWPTVTASSQPDPATFGGLPVNMPAVFQMNAAPWGGFLSPAESYRGWTTQIVANATSMRFVLVFDPDSSGAETITVPCVSAGADLLDTGWIPARDPSVPDFAEPGQFSAPCVWIPPEPGQVTVTAEVTYEVDSIVTGPAGRRFREGLTGEVRPSASLSLRVDDLRIVNVNPPPLDEALAGSDR